MFSIDNGLDRFLRFLHKSLPTLISLLIQWLHQNGFRMPERRKSAPELTLLNLGQLEEIEAIEAAAFVVKDDAGTEQQQGS